MARGIFQFWAGRRSAVRSAALPTRSHPRRPPSVEVLENRTLLAVLTVDIARPDCALPRDELFCQIGQAINAAAPGSKIKVMSGIYAPIVIGKANLQIIGAGAVRPIIDGGGNTNTTVVTFDKANGATLDGFEIRNGTTGVRLVNVISAGLLHSEIHHNTNDGVRLERSYSALFVNNASHHNGSAGVANESAGFHVDSVSALSNFTENVAHDNRDGFVVDGANNFLKHNVATQNTLTGFELNSDYNILEGNVALDNGATGFVVANEINTLKENAAVRNRANGFEIRRTINPNVLEKNTAQANALTGFVALANSAMNQLKGNKAAANQIGFRDLSIGELGKPTFGTRNVYLDNKCQDNTVVDAIPGGLCRPRPRR